MEGRVLKRTEPETPRLPTRGNHPREEGGGGGAAVWRAGSQATPPDPIGWVCPGAANSRLTGYRWVFFLCVCVCFLSQGPSGHTYVERH